MRKRIGVLLVVSCLLTSVLSFGMNAKAAEKKELYVLAAASMTDVLTEMADGYEKEHPNVKLTFSFASSGDLQTQIEEGAPADLFVSASKKQMTALDDQDLMDKENIIELLENKCVLIQPIDASEKLTSFENLASDKISMVAIGNPESVPVGQYTKTIFENLNLWNEIEAKANYAKDVRQVLDWVATGNVECGIVYATDAAIEDQVQIICEAPEGSCDPAIYPAGIVKASENPEEAKDFLEYLKTKEAKELFEKYQFTYIYKE